MEEIQVYEAIDYTNSLDLIYEELVQSRELQITQINNFIDFIQISFILVGLIIGCILGLGFIKVGFKDVN